MRYQYRPIICVFFCLLTWRGPIAVVHCHGSGSLGERAGAHHLETYHSGEQAASRGWHFHIMLWSDIASEGPDEDQPHPSYESEVVGTYMGSVDSGSTNLRGTFTPRLCRQSVDSFSSMQRSGDSNFGSPTPRSSFLTSLLSAQPLCAVLSVSLC